MADDNTSSASAQQWSLEVANTSRSNRGNIRRCANPSSTPRLGWDGCWTAYESFRRGCDVNPLGPCLGFRAVSSSGFATPFIYSSYTECLARCEALAAGLDKLNLLQRNEDGLLLLGLYMKNCVEWILAEQAIFCLGGATVPFYDTLGAHTVEFILNQTHLSAVVATRAELPRLCDAKQQGCPAFQYVILVDGVTTEAAQQAQQAQLTVLSFAKAEAVGAEVIATTGHKHSPPSGSDVATFCYTSGTTGNPKGALITHTNLVSAMAGMVDATIAQIEPSDRHLSYLPLAHIFERIVMTQVLACGASMAFFRGDPLLLMEDVQACRPTIFAAVPRVLNKIYDKIMAGVHTAGGMKKRLFLAGLHAKTEGLKRGHLKHSLYDALLFHKIKKALGFDCLRYMISGSAPLSESVMIFFRCLLGIPVMEGYGQTEGSAAATVSLPEDIATVGHVGGPTGATEVVLVDVPEMGYLHTDTNHQGRPCRGRGEICVRGPAIFAGYYKEPEKTKETVDEEGWLHSGDVGLWTPEGQLCIIDRKKNIFKLAQGEYVAAEKIENVLTGSTFIAQCFVYGNSFQNYLVAIVVPEEEVVRNWAKEEGRDSMDYTLLCQDARLEAKVMEEIRHYSQRGGLQGFETVKKIHITANLFSMENGLLTPTFKLKRPQLKDQFTKEIDAMYEGPAPVKTMTSKL